MKQRYLTPLILLSLILSACALVNLAAPESSGQTQCAYMWALHELPELSQKVAASFQAVDPNLTGSAYAYGEDCVYADGHSTFSTMETDFKAKVTVKDLQDEISLGNWIVRVMDVVIKLPADEIPGGQPGRVDFEFSKSASETLFLNVSIAKYKSQITELTGAEIFRLFNNNP